MSRDKNGKMQRQAVFDTSAFGVCTSVGIEKVDDVEYIFANYKIWKRFTNACKIIQDRADSLHTSWEITVEESTQKVINGIAAKIIDKGRFIGLALLSEYTPPAYDSSGLLEVASQEENELNTALIQDCLDNDNIDIERSDINNDIDKEVNMELENKGTVETSESAETIDNKVQETSENIDTQNTETSKCGDDKKKENSEAKKEDEETAKKKKECAESDDSKSDEPTTETSALTERDIRGKLYNTIKGCFDIMWLFPADGIVWIRDYDRRANELDLVEYKFHIENDEVVIDGEPLDITLTGTPKSMTEQIAQKDSAIAEMSAQINKLSNEISELQPYKTKVEEIEKAEKEAQLEKDRKELSEYAISSGYITSEELEASEELKTMISELNKSGIKSVIADRVVAKLNTKEDVVETSEQKSNEQNVQINLSAVDSTAEDKKVNVQDARTAVRNYIGRK